MSMREKLKSKWILLSGLVVVAILAVGGIAWAMGFGSDELRGDDFDRASEAALAHVGEGTVVSADRGDRDDVEAFNVEVLRTDGSEVDVLLDENFEVIAAEEIGRDALIEFEIPGQKHRFAGAGVVVEGDQFPAQEGGLGVEGAPHTQAGLEAGAY